MLHESWLLELAPVHALAEVAVRAASPTADRAGLHAAGVNGARCP